MKKITVLKILCVLIPVIAAVSLCSCTNSGSGIISGSGAETQDYTFENVMTVTVPGTWTTEITEKGTLISAEADELTQGVALTLMDADKNEITVADAAGYMIENETDVSDITQTEINGISASYFDLSGTNTADDGTVKMVYGRYYLIQIDETRIVAMGLLNCEENDFAFADSILSSVTLISED